MSDDKQIVIVGLGNPGKDYALTRHNLGYLVVQSLAHTHGWVFKDEKTFHATVAKGKIGPITVHLMLPLTYMNESGLAVRRYLDYYKLRSQQVLIVVDDIDLPYGEMRVRMTGSPGGHNGLKSIQAHLGTQNYVRLRMGIGRQQQHETLAEYVLDTFSPEERLGLASFLEKGADVAKRLANEEVSAVMNSVNTKLENKHL